VKLSIEVLEKSHHDRRAFDCGLSAVDDFLQQRARKQMDQRINRTWVAVDAATERPHPAPIAGFYTLTHATVTRDEFPTEHNRSPWPAYPVPVVKLAWLGVTSAYQGTALRLGETLLLSALEQADRIVTQTGLGIAVITDPLTPESNRFFGKYGFQVMARPFGERQTLLLPIGTVRLLLRG
jgi:hypothetical protein